MDTDQFEARKRDHIRHALDRAHQAVGLSGLDRVHLVHEALPELDFTDISIAAGDLRWQLPTPFFVAGMTAGHEQAGEINRTLALACEKRGWAMGVGSQRRELAGSPGGSGASISADSWKRLREEAPQAVMFANIGMSQLIESSSLQLRGLVQSFGAQALVVHVNALQEALQPEGTPRFRGGLEALRHQVGEMEVPVILKETGCGFSRATCERLKDVNLAAIDVSGLGGTHWGRIEGARAGENSMLAAASRTFAEWGEPTVTSVVAASEVLGSTMEVWASGGVRSGLDAAKYLALGAHRVGYAKPALEAALQGMQPLLNWMELQEYELKLALFCTGCAKCEQLRSRGVWTVE